MPVSSSNIAQRCSNPGEQVGGCGRALVLTGVAGQPGVPGEWVVGHSGAMVLLDGLAIPMDGQLGTADHWSHWAVWRSQWMDSSRGSRRSSNSHSKTTTNPRRMMWNLLLCYSRPIQKEKGERWADWGQHSFGKLAIFITFQLHRRTSYHFCRYLLYAPALTAFVFC